MLKKTLIMLSLLCLTQASEACTLWASVGTANQSDQLLFVKNRDAPLRSWQQLQWISPPQGYRYLALRYKNQPSDPAFQYISAGINQMGLNVADNDIGTSASFGNEPGSDIMQAILQHYASVDAVLKDQKTLFSHAAAQNLLIADRSQVITVEITPAGHYAIAGPIKQGVLFHTNHYLTEAFIPDNDPVSPSTFMRYNRIAELLQATPFTQRQFENFAIDQSVHHEDGSVDTNNNILRKVTLATWIVAIPTEGPPRLHLQERNPQQPKQDIHLVLNSAFWQQPA